MKGKYLIAIAFLASWTVIAASELPSIFEPEYDEYDECPAVDTCPPKLISHESDCTKYYECKNGRKELRACAPGYYFSLTWRGCVDRQNSDCRIPTPTIPTPTTPSSGDCVNGDRLPHECKCTKFYECKYNRKVLRECPVNHVFDVRSKSCLPGTNCTIPTAPPVTPPVRECDPEGALIPHECECIKYYQCKNGRKALRECDKGMHFDKSTYMCVPGACGTVCNDGDAKKHDCGCEIYYRCYNNEWILERCPNDQHFNEAKKTCMNIADAGCDPGACAGYPSMWPHECDCRLYYQCKNKKKVIQACDWGKYFSKATLECDITSNIKDCKNDWDSWA